MTIRLLLAAAAIAGLLVFLLREPVQPTERGVRAEVAAPGAEGERSQVSLVEPLPEEPSTTPTGERETFEESGQRAASTEPLPRGLAVYAFGPDRSPLADLLTELGFTHDAHIEVRALYEQRPLGSIPDGNIEGHFDLRVRDLGRYDREGCAGVLGIQGKRELFVDFVLEERVCKVAFVQKGQDRIELELTAEDLEPWFGEVRVGFLGVDPDEDLSGAVRLRLPRSGELVTPVSRLSPSPPVSPYGVRIRGLPGRAYELVAKLDGYGSWRRSIELEPGAMLDLGVVQLERERLVAGRVNALPVDASYRLVVLTRIVSTGFPSELGDTREVESDENGRFVFEDVPAGEWSVRVAQRAQPYKLLEFPPSLREDAGVLSHSGRKEQLVHGGLSAQATRLEDALESPPVWVDTRRESVSGVRLDLIPPHDVHFQSLFLGEPHVRCELVDALGLPVQSWHMGPEEKVLFQLLPGNYVARFFRDDTLVGERSFEARAGIVISAGP